MADASRANHHNPVMTFLVLAAILGKEHLAGEGVVPRVQRRKLAHQLEEVGVAGEPVEQDTASGYGVLGGRSLPGRHITTVGQNHRPPGGLTSGCSPPIGVAR
jgi:hypothetical protein